MASFPLLKSADDLWRRAKKLALAHKFWASVLALLVLYGGYRVYAAVTAPSTATRYITTTVATGTVVATMTETGQVSASNQVDVNAKASGEVLSLLVAPGQHVSAGAAIAYIDPTTAQQAVTSAEQALQAAQISYQKLVEPAATSSLTASQNSVAGAEAALTKDHEDGYNDIAAAFLDLPSVVNGLDTTLHGYNVPGRTAQRNENAYADMIYSYDSSVNQYETAAESSFITAQAAYNKALNDFKATPRSADNATLEALVTETYGAAADLSDALKASTTFLNFVNTTLTNRQLSIPSVLTSQISSLTAFTNTTNTHVASLSADASSISSDERALAAAQASLEQLQSGADPLDIQSSQLSIQEKRDALAQAEQDLADTVVRAPFAGTIASISVQKYQTISSGSAVALMVSDNQNVDISVNEVDAAKLQVGQKATLTFDALPDVSIAGTVSSVNAIGTVTQGVVSYDAVVTFDTPNASVKPGMSATADIITGTQTGLTVPASAVKSSGGRSYVLVFNPPLTGSESATGAPSITPPTQVFVTTGLTDDTGVIITDGLLGGEQVVRQTIAGTSATTASTAAQSTSLFGGTRTSGSAAGGGAVRILTR